MRKLYLLLFFIFGLGMHVAFGQTGVLDPNDSVVTYNPAAPPTEPAWGSIGKWVRTARVGWDASSYKCYIYKGVPFRLKFPKNFNPANPKKYPLIMFFHGIGEKGTIYDNEIQLVHGGETHKNKVDNGTFDGFLIYPQNQSGFFGNPQYDVLAELINNILIPQLNIDPFRIMVEGLSGGATSTWDFSLRYPKMVAGFTPISGFYVDYINNVNTFKYTPVWLFQGELDTNPTANNATTLYNNVIAAGGNMKLTIYAGEGHGVWNKAWAEADYFPFMNRANKANPWAVGGRTEFCPGDPINVTLGLTAGFDEYQWRKDSVLISGATGNTYVATTLGVYDARVRSGSTWSDWSPIPVKIRIKTPTVSPDIQLAGLMSKVIPAPDGKDSVVLQVPTGYTSYVWKNAADTTVTLGTKNTLAVRQAGNYIVKVTELYGCSSSYSAPFTVVPSNGPNKPDAAYGALVTDQTKTSLTLSWNKNASQANAETGYEIYRATTAGGPYTFAGIVGAGVLTFTDQGLASNKKYYYVVRAVNNTGAAAVSNEANGTTLFDNVPPTPPGNLTVTTVTRSSIGISWTASTDDVGIDKYDIYINGQKSYTVDSSQTTFTAYGLTNRQIYTFKVVARDKSGNLSTPSNQVSSPAISKGLTYKYYSGTFSTLPNFSTLTPVKTGVSATPDLSVRLSDINYAIQWQGYIRIPASGTYKFETYSDDGSRLYLNNSATPLVDNDGLHGGTYKAGTITLAAGVYPITIAYFQQGGGADMKVYWQSTAMNVTSRQEIPASAYADTITLGPVPAAATNVKATALSYNKIQVTWNDNSNNETGFEIYRATSLAGPYTIVTTAPANATSYTDSSLTPQTTYYYQVKALNKNGTAGASLSDISGLQYEYYEANSYSNLPDFNSLTPKKTGMVPNVTLAVRDRDVNYALRFSGYINIPVSGQYTFYTSSDDGSKLYIDGFDEGHRVVNNDYLQGTTERSGVVTLSAGRHAFYTTYFQSGGGAAFTISYKRGNGAKTAIPDSVFVNNNIRATTLALPSAPTAPSNLTGTSTASGIVDLKWNDNSNNETGFDIYRSVGNNVTYLLLTTKASSDSSKAVFRDTALLANTLYYYKVRAKNDGGNSAFSNEVGVTTYNTPPVLQAISDLGMRYGTQVVVNLKATDPDNETITLSTVDPLPAFATLANNGNGTGTITFNPGIGDQGVYTIQVKATDQHSGIATRSFTLTVNDNYPPVLNAVSDLSMSAGSSTQINLTATDQNASDALTWSTTGLPSFATFSNTNGNAQIQLAPGFGDAGVYPVTVTVSDGKSGIDSKTFTITVKTTNPSKVVYINFNDGSSIPGGYWNSTNKPPVQNDVYPNLKDSTNTATSIGFKVISPWQNQNNGTNISGAVTGNNSGVYPDNVIRTAWWSGAGAKQTLQLQGLTLGANYKYNVTFFGSRGGVSDNRTSVYTINGTSVSLNAANNTTNTVTISNVIPDSTGSVLIDIINGSGSSFSYLNAMVIEAAFDDHQPPVVPRNIAAQLAPGAVKVSWTDAAYNETGYEVHRATAPQGPFTLVKTTPANATSTLDSNISGSTRYYYLVRSVNSYGASAFSDTANILTANVPPVLAAISNVNIKTTDTVNVAISATGDVGKTLTITATGLPSFAKLTDNGNGTGTITLTPGSGDVGVYNNITVKVTDSNGDFATKTFSITVKDKNLTAVYVNFNETNGVGAPWNSFNTFPYAGRAISNLLADDGTASGMTITLVDALAGSNTLGAVTGNNSGVYPDNVMQTAFFESAVDAKRIRITGLSSTKKYNLIFFGSRADVADNRNTEYTVGTQTVTLNAASNTKNTVQLNGLSPDASGQIEFTIKRASGSSYAYINALVIQAYTDLGIPNTPTQLQALGKSRSTIALTWQDNASNETGYEVYRAGSPNGTYTKLTTLPANSNSYTDNGLSENTGYYYKVRAITATTVSDYSNITNGQTYAYSMYLQFTRDQPAGAPWNATNSLPYEGDRYANLQTDQGDNSGLAVTIVKNFVGDNIYGKVTGNNSGVYPDLVLRSSYWVDGLNVARLRVDGLNQSQAYTFTFFGSRDAGGDRTSIYEVNGVKVALDCAYNTTKTVQIDNIRPDENGYAYIDIYLGPQSQFAYLGALVISSYGVGTTSDDPNSGSNLQQLGRKTSTTAAVQPAYTSKPELTTNNEELEIQVKAYPNPFETFVNLSMDRTPHAGVMTAKLFDSKGSLVYAKVLSNAGGGAYNERLDFGNKAQAPGLYLLQITADNKVVKTLKLIKY